MKIKGLSDLDSFRLRMFSPFLTFSFKQKVAVFVAGFGHEERAQDEKDYLNLNYFSINNQSLKSSKSTQNALKSAHRVQIFSFSGSK